jgi:hypothetical protein
MNNVSKSIRQAYYDALNGNVSVSVYKENVLKTEKGNHILIRLESETDNSHKSGFVTSPVVIIECVSVFHDSIDPDIADDIDNEVRNILLPSVGSMVLLVDGLRISNIKPESSTFVSEDDGSKLYYTKITRWQQRISHS